MANMRVMEELPSWSPTLAPLVGPPPINLENRPQVDTSFSRPVWPQFCFYPLRGITQRTQSDGRWLRSGFVEVGNQ